MRRSRPMNSLRMCAAVQLAMARAQTGFLPRQDVQSFCAQCRCAILLPA